MSCNTLTRCLISNPCPEPAGINPRVYVGFVRDIDTSVLTFGTDGEITAFGLDTGANLRRFESRRFKNTASHEIVKGENGVVTYNHRVDLKHYINTQADIAAIEELAKAQDLFVIVQTNSGKLKVYGLDRLNPEAFGLSASEGSQSEGTNLGDDNADMIVLSGEVTNKPMYFIPSNTLAANLTLLNGLTVCP